MKFSFCILALVLCASVYTSHAPFARQIPIAKRTLNSQLLSGAWFQIAKTGAKNACQCSQVEFVKTTDSTYAVNTHCLSGEEKGRKTSTMNIHADKKAVDIQEDGMKAQYEYTIMKDQLIIFENRLTDEARVMSRNNCANRSDEAKRNHAKRVLQVLGMEGTGRPGHRHREDVLALVDAAEDTVEGDPLDRNNLADHAIGETRRSSNSRAACVSPLRRASAG